MKPLLLTLLTLVGLSSFAVSASAANSSYELLILACDSATCERLDDQTIAGGIENLVEYNRNGLKLQIETIARRSNEADTRVSLNVGPAGETAGAWRAAKVSFAQRVETLVVQCTLKRGAFRPLTSFVSGGTNYQIWARLADAR